tara:strand:+ start:9209 stop:9505 length:297 start_codon:yes stop_codon:yes gene_type:complete
MKHNDELRKEYEDLTDSSAYSNKEKQQLHYGYTLWLEDKIGQSLPIDSVSVLLTAIIDGFIIDLYKANPINEGKNKETNNVIAESVKLLNIWNSNNER